MTRTEIINYLVDLYGYKTYLEIGVDNPNVNFNRVKARIKTGVDPNVNTTHKITSDQFFSTNKQTFDIIFIDGLHHHDQVIRDIQNALNFLNTNGTIVVHDCNPTTEAMQQVPRVQGEWTGDVWKAWIHFRKDSNLSMYVLDTDYGVGIIRKGSQVPIKEHSFHYSDFAQHKRNWLNLVPVKPDPISVVIPAFEQYGHGAKTLTECLRSVYDQRDCEFEVVVSDNAQDGTIKAVCDKFGVKYHHNPVRGISNNTNNAIEKASYPLIKILYQDDGLATKTALKDISFALKFDQWVICSGFSIQDKMPARPRNPRWTDDLLKGQNKLGMPSIIGIRKNDLRFDPNLKTLLDCEYYWLMDKKYGQPGYIRKHIINSRYWNGSTSRQQGNFSEQEYEYLKQKHGL